MSENISLTIVDIYPPNARRGDKVHRIIALAITNWEKTLQFDPLM